MRPRPIYFKDLDTRTYRQIGYACSECWTMFPNKDGAGVRAVARACCAPVVSRWEPMERIGWARCRYCGKEFYVMFGDMSKPAYAHVDVCTKEKPGG